MHKALIFFEPFKLTENPFKFIFAAMKAQTKPYIAQLCTAQLSIALAGPIHSTLLAQLCNLNNCIYATFGHENA